MPEVRISVRGHHPLTYGNQEWEWRRVVADRARAQRAEIQEVGIDRSTAFTVEVVFFFKTRGMPPADLDNLAKPILDTLFRVDNPQVEDLTLTGALFDVDDRGVCRLVLEKRRVASADEEGAEVSVSWDA